MKRQASVIATSGPSANTASTDQEAGLDSKSHAVARVRKSATERKFKIIIAVLLTILPGALLSICLPPIGLYGMAPFALWPIFYIQRYYNCLAATMLGVLAGMSFAVFCASWMFATSKLYSGFTNIQASFDFALFAILFHLRFPVFFGCVSFLFQSQRFRSVRPRWLVLGLIAVLTDRILPQLFPVVWGNFIAANETLAQICEITGINGLSIVLVVSSYWAYRIGSMLFGALPMMRRNVRRLTRAFYLKRILLIPSILLLALIIAIWLKHRALEYQESTQKVRVAIVQGNSRPAPSQKERFLSKKEIAQIMFADLPRLTHAITQGAHHTPITLTILPESTVPYYTTQLNEYTRDARSVIYYEAFAKLIQNIAKDAHTSVLFNETTRDLVALPSGRQVIRDFNSATTVSPEGVRLSSYEKRNLTAGEEVILTRWVEDLALDRIFPGLKGSRFHRGRYSSLLPYTHETKTRFVMPLICFEAILSDYPASFFKQNEPNPDFMVNIVQDGWFGRTAEPFQHFELARIRSIEYRRSLVRAANTGISGAIDIMGQPITPRSGPTQTNIGQQVIQIIDVPISSMDPTLFARFGLSWLYALSGISLGFWIYRTVRSVARISWKAQNSPTR